MSGEAPAGWASVPLSKIAKVAMGETLLSKDLTGAGLPVFSANTDDGPWGYTDKNRKTLRRGAIVIGARGSIGFPRLPSYDEFTSTQTTIAVEPDIFSVDSGYLHAALCAADIKSVAAQQAIPMLTIGMLAPLSILLPPLDEQRRIAEVLRSVDEVATAQEASLRAALSVRQATLDDVMRREASATEFQPLEAVAEVRTGLAKNAGRQGEKVSLPYLRVANVQDGWIDLSEVKTVDVDPKVVPRYSLQMGDVLLTEGGDYDKLGRGGVWMGEIAPCLHQNHVFAVRPDPTSLSSAFLALLTQSYLGRAYFLSCAKRTTNLASINSSQLKSLPVPQLPLTRQQEIASEIGSLDRFIAIEKERGIAFRQLRNALSHDLLSGHVRVPA